MTAAMIASNSFCSAAVGGGRADVAHLQHGEQRRAERGQHEQRDLHARDRHADVLARHWRRRRRRRSSCRSASCASTNAPTAASTSHQSDHLRHAGTSGVPLSSSLPITRCGRASVNRPWNGRLEQQVREPVAARATSPTPEMIVRSANMTERASVSAAQDEQEGERHDERRQAACASPDSR